MSSSGNDALILRSSPPSPFGRKVKLVAAVTGQDAHIRVEEAATADPGDSLREQNPLGKIPTLILADGTALYDSRVICAFLDAHSLTGARVIPDGEDRWHALRLQALGDGIMDAGILQVYEARMRPPERRHAEWTDYQQAKIDRALAVLEADPPALGTPPTIGDIAIACALGYLDLRFDGVWRGSHPKLVDWIARFEAALPAFAKTRITA